MADKVQTLLDDFILPLLCLTPSEIDEFDSDPTEYLVKAIDPKSAKTHKWDASQMLISLLRFDIRRPNSMGPGAHMQPFMAKLFELLNTQKDSPLVIDAIFFSIQTLSSLVLQDKDLHSGLEAVFKDFVLPCLNHSNNFLTARALRLIFEYELEQYSDQLVGLIAEAVMPLLAENQPLPIRALAGIVMKDLSRYEVSHSVFIPHLETILKCILDTMDQFFTFELIDTLKIMITVFDDKIINHAINLCNCLAETYKEVLGSMGDFDPNEEDSQMAVKAIENANGCL